MADRDISRKRQQSAPREAELSMPQRTTPNATLPSNSATTTTVLGTEQLDNPFGTLEHNQPPTSNPASGIKPTAHPQHNSDQEDEDSTDSSKSFESQTPYQIPRIGPADFSTPPPLSGHVVLQLFVKRLEEAAKRCNEEEALERILSDELDCLNELGTYSNKSAGHQTSPSYLLELFSPREAKSLRTNFNVIMQSGRRAEAPQPPQAHGHVQPRHSSLDSRLRGEADATPSKPQPTPYGQGGQRHSSLPSPFSGIPRHGTSPVPASARGSVPSFNLQRMPPEVCASDPITSSSPRSLAVAAERRRLGLIAHHFGYDQAWEDILGQAEMLPAHAAPPEPQLGSLGTDYSAVQSDSTRPTFQELKLKCDLFGSRPQQEEAHPNSSPVSHHSDDTADPEGKPLNANQPIHSAEHGGTTALQDEGDGVAEQRSASQHSSQPSPAVKVTSENPASMADERTLQQAAATIPDDLKPSRSSLNTVPLRQIAEDHVHTDLSVSSAVPEAQGNVLDEAQKDSAQDSDRSSGADENETGVEQSPAITVPHSFPRGPHWEKNHKQRERLKKKRDAAKAAMVITGEPENDIESNRSVTGEEHAANDHPSESDQSPPPTTSQQVAVTLQQAAAQPVHRIVTAFCSNFWSLVGGKKSSAYEKLSGK